jgi:hypothetical protein
MDRIRTHARAEAKRTSMRDVARRAGVTLGSTKKFIDGATPYEQNARLWTAWMVREIRAGLVDSPDDSVGPEDAACALDLVLWAFPDEDREQIYPEALDALRALYRRHDRSPPSWIDQLAENPPGRAATKRRRTRTSDEE